MTDKRTKAQLLEDLALYKRVIEEKDRELFQQGANHQKATSNLERELFNVRIQSNERRKLLKLQALGGIRVASFLEGKVEGVMAAFKTLLSNTKTSDDDFPPELGKILEEMAQDLADVDDDFDEEDETGVD